MAYHRIHPDPAVQMLTLLSGFKRSGARPEDFDRCWDAAWTRLRMPHRTVERKAWWKALASTREEWRASWIDGFTRTGAAVTMLAA